MASHERVALLPLRQRALALQQQCEREQEAAIARWRHSEKPALKEFAHTLRETEKIQLAELELLKQRVAGMATTELASQPGGKGVAPPSQRVTTGFNVIRSRVGSDGEPLSVEALRQEKERLTDTLAHLNVAVAGAKAEVTQHRRVEEQEIWETKLVALQASRRERRCP